MEMVELAGDTIEDEFDFSFSHFFSSLVKVFFSHSTDSGGLAWLGFGRSISRHKTSWTLILTMTFMKPIGDLAMTVTFQLLVHDCHRRNLGDDCHGPVIEMHERHEIQLLIYERHEIQ